MVDHPIVAGLAVVSALPFGWPVIRAFASSATEDLDDAARNPVFAHLGWFPEWTLMKFVWLFIVLAALTITFYNVYSWLGGLLGVLP